MRLDTGCGIMPPCRHDEPNHGHGGEVPSLRARVASPQAGRAPALPPVLQAADMRHALTDPTRWERVLAVVAQIIFVMGFGLVFCILALLLGA